jgi:cytochrome P450 family 6
MFSFVTDEPDFTMDEMTAQVMVFFTGGFETSSVTMSFCLYELAMNMDIQKSLSTEIDAVLGRYGGNITYEAVKEMKYLDKVVSGEMQMFDQLT